MNAPAAIGHNLPSDPFEAFKLDLDDLFSEASNFLDGQPIETQQQADDMSALVNRLRKSIGGADEYRKAEKKPHDDAAAAVHAKWMEPIGRARIALETARKALAAYLIPQEAAQRVAAQALQEEANRQAEAAAQAAANLKQGDLAGETAVRAKMLVADEARKAAAKADKARPMAKGGERAVSLRSRWTATLSDSVAALKHYREHQPAELKAWLTEQAQRDVNAGARVIPGFHVEETKTAA